MTNPAGSPSKKEPFSALLDDACVCARQRGFIRIAKRKNPQKAIDASCGFSVLFSRDLHACSRRRLAFQPLQVSKSFLGGRSAHFRRRRQAAADRRAFGTSEQLAAFVLVQLHARYAGRLAARHTGDRRSDRDSRAAGSATFATFEIGVHLIGFSPVPGTLCRRYRPSRSSSSRLRKKSACRRRPSAVPQSR